MATCRFPDDDSAAWLGVVAARVAAAEVVVLVALVEVAALRAEARFWWPLLAAAPLVAIALWFDMRSRSRRLLPELAGTVAWSAGAVPSLLGSPAHWFDGNAIARTVQVKLGPLAVTVGLAVHARFRVIPKLSDATLPTLAWHIRIGTLATVLFVLAGASIRFGGYPVFDR